MIPTNSLSTFKKSNIEPQVQNRNQNVNNLHKKEKKIRDNQKPPKGVNRQPTPFPINVVQPAERGRPKKQSPNREPIGNKNVTKPSFGDSLAKARNQSNQQTIDALNEIQSNLDQLNEIKSNISKLTSIQHNLKKLAEPDLREHLKKKKDAIAHQKDAIAPEDNGNGHSKKALRRPHSESIQGRGRSAPANKKNWQTQTNISQTPTTEKQPKLNNQTNSPAKTQNKPNNTSSTNPKAYDWNGISSNKQMNNVSYITPKRHKRGTGYTTNYRRTNPRYRGYSPDGYSSDNSRYNY